MAASIETATAPSVPAGAASASWVRFLRDLVAVPSPTGDTDAAVAFFTDALAARGFETHRDAAGNAIAIAGRGERTILLVGHVDTVPGDLPVRLADGWLTGRGSVDAKGSLAAFAATAERFLANDDVRVVVVGACDEEGESHGARHLTSRWRPDALVVGEPSGVAGVTMGYKGIVRIRYAVEEDLAHTGAPFPTVADRGLAFWTALQGYLAGRHGASLFDTPTAKLTSFQTRLLPTGRERAELVGNVRTPPAFDVADLRAFLATRAGPAALDVPEAAPAWVGDKNSSLARAFVAAVRAEGLTPRYVKKTGTSDANLLAPAWGCPTVAYGPGDAALDHTPHERLAIADYLQAIGVLERAIRGWVGECGGRAV